MRANVGCMKRAVGEGPRVTDTKTVTGGAELLGAARAAVRELLSSEPADARDTAVLLTNELVTNAVVHGGGRFVLTAETSGSFLRVRVVDPSEAQPRPLALTCDREHGRGVAIVDALATRWGSNLTATGKVVWFELDLEKWRRTSPTHAQSSLGKVAKA